MDENNNLIIIKGQDKTADISFCKYDSGKYLITFSGGKTYPHNYLNVTFVTNPINMSLTEYRFYEDGKLITGIDRVLYFEGYYKIFFTTGFKKHYCRRDIRIEKSILAQKNEHDRFDYFKKVSALLNDLEDGFLYKQYSKLDYISPQSALATYLGDVLVQPGNLTKAIIYPFGFNLSQKTAVEKALKNQLSVIEGPPGTGKTQTILNIISNVIIAGYTVAVVSNNNSATENVFEKLEKYNVGWLVAKLGNKDNKAKFIDSQINETLEIEQWKLSPEKLNVCRTRLSELQASIDKMLLIQNQVAQLKQQLAEIQIERKHFDISVGNSNVEFNSIYKMSASNLMFLWNEYQIRFEKGKDISFGYKLKNLLRYGIYSFGFYNLSQENIISFLQLSFYNEKENELKNQIESLEQKLKVFNFDNAMKKYSQCSLDIFRDYIAKKRTGKARRIFKVDDLWKNTDAINNEYPIITSTTHALRSSVSKGYMFDYVIIDEASQVDVITGALALSCAKNAVIVGDTKQLPHIVPDDIRLSVERLNCEHGIEKPYHYDLYSLLSSFKNHFPHIPQTLLREHYRCHPLIINFCNQKFYNNELIVLTSWNEESEPLAIYKTVKGNHARGTSNQRQIDVINEEVLPALKHINPENIGLVAPYKAQVTKLGLEMIEDFEAKTVHKYQGREKDVIIMSTVSNEVNDFLDNPNLLNVAVSRAIKRFILVTADYDKERSSNIRDLIGYIEYNSFQVIKSKVRSIFDLLYSCYYEERMRYIKKAPKGEFLSEQLMYSLIQKILDADVFCSLDCVGHYPLSKLIYDVSLLDESEIQYAMNPNTHIDFLIFNRIDKRPVAAFEIDGVTYHRNNPVQEKRDIMKDNILQRYGIPIKRFSTDSSNEEKKLSEFLLETFKNGV